MVAMLRSPSVDSECPHGKIDSFAKDQAPRISCGFLDSDCHLRNHQTAPKKSPHDPKLSLFIGPIRGFVCWQECVEVERECSESLVFIPVGTSLWHHVILLFQGRSQATHL